MDINPEIRANEVREEIAREGMPAAIRPPLLGTAKVIDPARPAEGRAPSAEPSPSVSAPSSEESIEERLFQRLLGRLERAEGVNSSSLLTPATPLEGTSKGTYSAALRAPKPKVGTVIPVRGEARNTGTKGSNKNKDPQAAKKKPGQTQSSVVARHGAGSTLAPPANPHRGDRGESKVDKRKGKGSRIGPDQRGSRPSGGATSSADQGWIKVGKKKKGEGKSAAETAAADTGKGSGKEKGAKSATTPPRNKEPGKRKSPKRAAVTLTCPPDQYNPALAHVRKTIKLGDFGIEALVPKQGITGAFIFEVPGEGSRQKAEALASKMKEVLAEREGVKVGCPQKLGELRIRGLDPSVTQEDILLTEIGSCNKQDVNIGEIRFPARGLGTVWLRCPLAAANKLARAVNITVGWCRARVEELSVRPLTCFKCLERGHTQTECRNPIDRRDCCYRCGEKGHVAKFCTALARCPACEEAGKPAGHRMGGAACPGPSKKKKKNPNSPSANGKKDGAASNTPAASVRNKKGVEPPQRGDTNTPMETDAEMVGPSEKGPEQDPKPAEKVAGGEAMDTN